MPQERSTAATTTTLDPIPPIPSSTTAATANAAPPTRKAKKKRAAAPPLAPTAVPETTLTTAAVTVAANPTKTATTTNKKKKDRRLKVTKAESKNAHYALVFSAAQAVVEIMKLHGLPCAVFGSLASKLYGSSRCPKDVDLLISQGIPPSSDGESSSSSDSDSPKLLSALELKNLILSTNSRNFYLKMPRDPLAEYRILWYRRSYLGDECKVDILVPGTMYLPSIKPDRVHWIDGIPLVPFSLLLLHKLQGWDDHRLAEEAHKSRKQHQDAADVKRLMALPQSADLTKPDSAKPWEDEELLSEEFMQLSKERVKAYTKAFPDRADAWKKLGFEVAVAQDI